MQTRSQVKWSKIKKEAKKSQDDSLSVVDDPYENMSNSKTAERLKTGLAINEVNVLHYCPWDEEYPETPKRYSSIIERLLELKLSEKCRVIPSREATTDEIKSVHDIKQIEQLRTVANLSIEKQEEFSAGCDAIFVNKASWQAASTAVGSCLNLLDAVMSGKIQNGMAIVRPPGHHASPDEFNGYCLYNNAAIVATQAIEKYGLSRILIFDQDVHHGQGIQRIFYESNKVLYFSIHRFEHGAFWPNLKESNYDYIGTGNGVGYNFNVPLNKTGMKNGDYLSILLNILLPVAYEFNPELVIISAGYDAAIGCPEGEMKITPAFFGIMTQCLMQLANGRVLALLEGGYCLPSLAESAAMTLRALIGEPAPSFDDLSPPCESVLDAIYNCIRHHSKYWRCFAHIGKPENRNVDKYVPYKRDESKKYPTRECYAKYSDETKMQIEAALGELQLKTKLRNTESGVAIVTEPRMNAHENIGFTHYEIPDRVIKTIDLLKDFGLLDRCADYLGYEASDTAIELVHDPEYITLLNFEPPEEIVKKFDSIYMMEHSLKAANVAVGSVLMALELVLKDRARSAFALVRPPGHHAERDSASGFCFFNNVSIAAHDAIKRFKLKRVLIIDFDVHHGNGIQNTTKDTKEILYISIHRYENGFFPGSKEANSCETGGSNAKGYNVNVPWSDSGMGDIEYLSSFHRIVLPIVFAFNPEVVLVSAGFDAAINDPLGRCKVTPEMFGHMTAMLMPLAQGKLVMCLEGGYNVTSVGYSTIACVKALLGDPLPSLKIDKVVCKNAMKTINTVVEIHKKHWPNLMTIAEIKEPSIFEGYKINPITDCPHLNHLTDVPDCGINIDTPCQVCQSTEENWMCLTCFTVGCSVYKSGHVKEHCYDHSHSLALGFNDLSVWCYSCDDYIDHSDLYAVKTAAHMAKFGCDMPYYY